MKIRKNAFLLPLAAALLGAAAWQLIPKIWPKTETEKVTVSKSQTTDRGEVPLHYPLLRELFRQSWLIAQRDAGLHPADQAIGDEENKNYPPMRVEVAEQSDGIHVELNSPTGTTVWKTITPFTNEAPDYIDVMTRGETLSRTDFGTFARQATSRPTPATAAAPAAGDLAVVDYHLEQLSIIPQFAAVHIAHTALRSSPGNPKALGTLARGYANLGQLTMFLWSPAHKVFTARSLLYAQRMVALNPTSAEALRHRAYAFALAGIHSYALRDLAAADKLAKPGDTAPPWVDLLVPYCRYDTDKLTDMAGEPRYESLGWLLAFLSIENSDSSAIINTFGQNVLKVEPDCLRVVDRMFAASGVSNNHVLSEAGQTAWASSLERLLPSIDDAPPKVRAALTTASTDNTPETWAAVAEAMIHSPDDGSELSWHVLGTLDREINFVHVQRRAAFLAEQLGVPTADFIAETAPLVKYHPYCAFLQCYAAPGMNQPQLARTLRSIKVVDPDFPMIPMFLKLHAANLDTAATGGPFDGHNFFEYLSRNLDRDSFDLERVMLWGGNQPVYMKFVNDRLKIYSPYSPMYMATLVRDDWAAAQPQIEGWSKEWGGHPTLAAALGRKYAELEQWPEVIRYLQGYVDIAPDFWAFQLLARAYEAQGKEDLWLATMKRVFDHPDPALVHSKANELIALHFMNRGDYTKALPYADTSSESGAAFGLEVAARCHEILGDWARAEQLLKYDSRRYGHPRLWWLFCKRNGRGNLEASEAAEVSMVTQRMGTQMPTEQLAVERIEYYLVKGDAKGALTSMQATESAPSAFHLLHKVILLDQTGDTASRDTTLKYIVRINQKPTAADGKSLYGKLAKYVIDSLAASPVKFDPEEAKKVVLATTDREYRINLDYFIAREMELHGQPDDALPFLKEAVGLRISHLTNYNLAWLALHARKVDPQKVTSEAIARDKAAAEKEAAEHKR